MLTHKRQFLFALPAPRVLALVIALFWLAGCMGPPQPPEGPFGVMRQSQTVAGATASGCSTAAVDGLSKQLFAELNCLRPSSIADFGSLPGVTKNASHVYAFLQPAAVASLRKVLARRPGATMNLTSALRSIAQQYLLYKWYRGGRCGIGLAASPGKSNHQSGLALDVSPYASWKSHFQAIGWRWQGSNDPVHFDYKGTGTIDIRSLSIKAFQRLWNRNNPSDKIAEDGQYGSNTEARLAKSPATGFAKGCTCTNGATQPCGNPAIGQCRRGSQTCNAGKWSACTGEVKPAPEICDGLDNSCDGRTDEGCDCKDAQTKTCGQSDEGACKKGTQTCKDGKWGTCVGEVQANPETCNGKDDDCNGQTDDGIPGNQPCQTGKPGECSAGQSVCKDGKDTCIAIYNPTNELCNDGKDNNCDGDIDEGCGGCTEGAVQDCGISVGECIPGKQLCENGKWSACARQIGPEKEICDDKDNDCDGQVDEELKGSTCDTGQTDKCKNGTLTCENGKGACVPPAGCSQEPPPSEQPGPPETPGLPEAPPVIDAGPIQDDPPLQQDRPPVKGPSGPCTTSLDCPTGQACSQGKCLSGLRPRGCGCSQSPTPHFAWWLLLLFLPLWRRARLR